MRRLFANRHDISNRNLFALSDAKPCTGIERRAGCAPGLAAHLVVIADDAIDLGHACEHFGLGVAPRGRYPRSAPAAARASAAGSTAAPAPRLRWSRHSC